MSGRKYIGPFPSQPIGSDGDVSLHAQTAAIAATGILGGAAPLGMYRVSLFHAVNVPGGGGTMQLIIKSFQEGPTGASSFALPPLLIADATGVGSGAFILTSNGSADITYEVDFVGPTVGSLQYSLRVVLEQLTIQV